MFKIGDRVQVDMSPWPTFNGVITHIFNSGQMSFLEDGHTSCYTVETKNCTLIESKKASPEEALEAMMLGSFIGQLMKERLNQYDYNTMFGLNSTDFARKNKTMRLSKLIKEDYPTPWEK